MSKAKHTGLPAPTENYKVFTAVKDSLQAIRNNLATVLGSIVIAILLSLGIGLVAILLIGSSILLNTSGFNANGFSIGVLASLLCLALVGALVSALVNIFMALSIDDGAQGKKTTLNNVFVRSQKLVVRVISTEIRLFVMILAPFFVVVLLGLLLGAGGGGSDTTLALAFMLPLLILAGVVWTVIILLRYCLAPLVAIFEPKLSVKETFDRSKHLVANGGQWFLVKAGLLVLAALIVVSMFVPRQNMSSGDNNSFMNLVSFLLSIVFTGVIVMLYRNRKAVRG